MSAEHFLILTSLPPKGLAVQEEHVYRLRKKGKVQGVVEVKAVLHVQCRLSGYVTWPAARPLHSAEQCSCNASNSAVAATTKARYAGGFVCKSCLQG